MTQPTSETLALSTSASRQAEDSIQAGLAASQANDTRAAISLFEQAAALTPESGLPHFLLGSEFAALGAVDKAELAFANAVLLAPAFHLARYQLGLLQFSSGRAAVALVSWGPLLTLDEGEALPHFVRGFAALAQDQFDAARAHFESGLERNSNNPALSDDIRKVMDRMEAPPEVPVRAAAEDHSANHILISNYGKAGTLH